MPDYTLDDLTKLAASEPKETKPPDDPMKYVMGKLTTDYGWSPVVAAGMVGNAWHESGGKTAVWGDSGKSFGLFQHSGPRRKALAEYATQRGRPADDIDLQIEFLNHELMTDYSNVADQLRKAKTPQEATQIFSSGYERPGKPMMGSRIAAAKRAYSMADIEKAAEATAATIPTDNKYQYTLEGLKELAGKKTAEKKQYTVEDLKRIAGQKAKSPEEITPEMVMRGAPEAGYIEPIGTAFGKVMEAPFIPLRKGLEKAYEYLLEPAKDRSLKEWSEALETAPEMISGAPEAFAPIGSKEAFVEPLEFLLAPAYLRFVGKAGQVLKEVGKENFYKYAPQWAFKPFAKGGLPVPLSSTEVVEKLAAMSGPERAEMARKYPQFRESLGDMLAKTEPTPGKPIEVPEIKTAEVPVKVPAPAPEPVQTIVDTAPQTRPEKITQHEAIEGQTKVNDVTYKGFVDILKGGDMNRAKEELAKITANFSVNAFDHHFNPLNLMGRLTDEGMELKAAQAIVKPYEKEVFKPVRGALTEKVTPPLPEPVPPAASEKAVPEVQAGARVAGEAEVKPTLEALAEKGRELKGEGTPKEIKKYALAAIDDALKGPFKGKGVPAQVIINIPGDGEFRINNTKEALETVKKAFEKFPIGTEKPETYRYPSIKPTGRRPALGDEGIEYTTDYIPHKADIIVKGQWPQYERGPGWGKGFYTDGKAMVKMEKPKSPLDDRTSKAIEDVIGKANVAEVRPAIIEGEYKAPYEKNPVVILRAGDERVVLQAKYFDAVLTQHPEAKPFIENADKPVLFKVGKELVGAVMPRSPDKEFEAFDALRGETPQVAKSTILDEEGFVSPELVTKPIQAVIEDAANIIREAPRQVEDAYDWIKDAGKRLWEWYKYPFEVRERGYRGVLGQYLGARQIAGFENEKFLKKIQTAVPDKISREGITNWIQAAGDEALLKERAEKSTGNIKAGYEAALRLTPEEKAIAGEISTQFDRYLKEAQEAGILESGLENYVNQLWQKKGHNQQELRKLRSEINAGLLNTNFNYAKKRVFDSYFTGEQAGYIPKNKDVAFLLGTYHQSMYEAIAARKAIKAMLDGVADDGRPLVSVSGGGKTIPSTEAPEAHLIRPKAMYEESADGRPYRPINHPALRKWKWVDKDAEGKPIFVQGDLYVHPDVYKHLRNVLGRSVVRDVAIGRAALGVSQNLKGLLLSGLPTPFHQVHLGSHAIFHKINPFTAPEIDFTNPLHRKAVEHGLMVYNHNALADFSEGLQPTGLARKIPGLGRITEAYAEYLFQDLIPRYKMKLFEEAYDRNTKRYGSKFTDDQIAEITANQANAAFGELNYKVMGRNPTMQDIFRLMALAPDFLEARLRFAGQAVRPGGREQYTALLRGVLGLYGIGVIGNMLFSDDKKPHWDKPFQFIVGERAYSMRSVPGDLIHLFSDPRSFVYHRLNPSILKPLVEFLSQRDVYGRKRTMGEQVGDYFKGVVPIPLQYKVSEGERTLLQSLIQTMGGTSWKYKSDLDKIMQEYSEKHAMLNLDPEEREKGKLKRKTQDLVREGKHPEAMDKMREAIKTNQLDVDTAVKWLEEGTEPIKEVQFKRLPLDWAAKAMLKATPDEDKMLMPLLVDKIDRAKDKDLEKAGPLIKQLIEKRKKQREAQQ